MGQMAETQKRPVAVVIPAKGTSTRVPRKNLALWRGKPLVVWSIDNALAEGPIRRRMRFRGRAAMTRAPRLMMG
jgi:CTP:molybdopterin cytidylyltransferase MocA